MPVPPKLAVFSFKNKLKIVSVFKRAAMNRTFWQQCKKHWQPYRVDDCGYSSIKFWVIGIMVVLCLHLMAIGSIAATFENPRIVSTTKTIFCADNISYPYQFVLKWKLTLMN